MRRRDFLAASGAVGTGSIDGCLGAGQGDTTASCNHESLPGRYQWRYDACNSGYAAEINGPTEEPEFQRIYRGAGTPLLSAENALYTQTWSAEIGGDTRWQIGEPSEA